MTITVKISIRVESETGEGKTVEFRIRSDNLEKDLKAHSQKITEEIGRQVLAGYEAKLKAGEYRAGVSIRTEVRRYHFQGFSLDYRRRSYKMPDGKVYTPLDDLLGFEKYQRRSWKEKEQISALATSLSYRDTARVNSYISQEVVSASTVCRVVSEVGKRIEEQALQFQATEAGKIKAAQLCCEADGIWVSLQKAEKRKEEIRVAIAYTGKKYISKDRRKLLNKVCLTGTGLSSQQWQEMIREKLYASYDLATSKQLLIGGDGSEWVGRSFDLVGVKPVTRILDPYHVKRAICSAFGNVVDTKQVIGQLYKDGFEIIEKTLLDAVVGGSRAEVKARLNCLQYLRKHTEEIIPGPSLGAIESTVGKLIAQRMKTRGVSWSVAGAHAMPMLLMHKQELFDNSFHYETIKSKKKERSKPRSKGENGTIHAASFPVLKAGKMSAPYAKLFKAIINEDLPLSS